MLSSHPMYIFYLCAAVSKEVLNLENLSEKEVWYLI